MCHNWTREEEEEEELEEEEKEEEEEEGPGGRYKARASLMRCTFAPFNTFVNPLLSKCALAADARAPERQCS